MEYHDVTIEHENSTNQNRGSLRVPRGMFSAFSVILVRKWLFLASYEIFSIKLMVLDKTIEMMETCVAKGVFVFFCFSC